MSEDSYRIRDDLPVIASAVATTVAAVAAVKIDHNLATIATAVGAVVTALIGYGKARRAEANARTVARIAADATLDTNARSVLVQTVTSERAVWRREVRAAAAELATVLREPEPTPTRDWTKVDRLGSEIRLRLNPLAREDASATGPHRLDHAVHAALDTLRELDRKAAGPHDGPADELERAIADLLKQEWTKSKREAVTGKLGDREADQDAGCATAIFADISNA